MIVRPELYFLNALLTEADRFEAFQEGAVDAYERVGLLSDHEAARWRERFVARQLEIGPRLDLGAEAGAKVESFLAGLVDGLTPVRREMDAAAIERNAACDAAIWSLHYLGVLDQDALRRWLTAAWNKLTPWRTEPPRDAVTPRPYALEAPVWAPPDNPQQAAQDVARAAKTAMTARIGRVLTGGPQRQGGLAIVALVVHAGATSLHFHYLGRPAAQIPPFQGQHSREAPDEALAPLTPPALSDNTGQVYQPMGDRPDPAGIAWVQPAGDENREAISGYWLYSPAACPDAHTFTVERDSHRWTLHDPPPGPGR